MRRLMELAARYSGQMLSYNKMLGQLQEAGNTTTLATYLDLLSDAGLVTGLPRYSAKPYPGRAASPKLNVLNTALMTAPLRRTFEEVRADRTFWGRLVESAVGAHLHNSGGSAVRLSYWRDGAHEVDFVLSRGPNLVGIEVKSGPRPGASQRTGGIQEAVPLAPARSWWASVGCRWPSFSPIRRATGPTTRCPPRPMEREGAVRSASRLRDTEHPRDRSRGMETRLCPGWKKPRTPSCATSESSSWRASASTRTRWRGAGGCRGSGI